MSGCDPETSPFSVASSCVSQATIERIFDAVGSLQSPCDVRVLLPHTTRGGHQNEVHWTPPELQVNVAGFGWYLKISKFVLLDRHWLVLHPIAHSLLRSTELVLLGDLTSSHSQSFLWMMEVGARPSPVGLSANLPCIRSRAHPCGSQGACDPWAQGRRDRRCHRHACAHHRASTHHLAAHKSQGGGLTRSLMEAHSTGSTRGIRCVQARGAQCTSMWEAVVGTSMWEAVVGADGMHVPCCN